MQSTGCDTDIFAKDDHERMVLMPTEETKTRRKRHLILQVTSRVMLFFRERDYTRPSSDQFCFSLEVVEHYMYQCPSKAKSPCLSHVILLPCYLIATQDLIQIKLDMIPAVNNILY
jgi:hypothetical protein